MNIIRIAMVGVICCACIYAETLNGYVIGVSDGDTVKVLDAAKTQHRIRLLGIDAPESSQAFGQKSKQYLSSLIFNKNISIDYKEKDKYGRILGTIYLEGENINLKMVQAGLAWHYVYFAKDNKELAEAEAAARKGKLGLWADAKPIPPWDYRYQKKRNAKGKNQAKGE